MNKKDLTEQDIRTKFITPAILYLIQNDIIPSIDTGKKTWRYKVPLL